MVDAAALEPRTSILPTGRTKSGRYGFRDRSMSAILLPYEVLVRQSAVFECEEESSKIWPQSW